MIYVPDLESYVCYSVYDKDTIRAYKTQPVLNQNVEYRDYYINSHYIYKDSSELISTIPVCLSNDILTDEIYYKNDYDSSLFIFSILAIVIVIIPTLLFMKIFKKRSI